MLGTTMVQGFAKKKKKKVPNEQETHKGQILQANKQHLKIQGNTEEQLTGYRRPGTQSSYRRGAGQVCGKRSRVRACNLH